MNRKIMKLPEKVTLIEVGPRDGFQLERKPIPTDLKLRIINGLLDAGIREIQVTSFVNHDLVPQMGDAEELISLLPEKKDATFSCLVLNERGLHRARKTGINHVEISVSASDTHSRKNTGMSHEAALKSTPKKWLKRQNHIKYRYGPEFSALSDALMKEAYLPPRDCNGRENCRIRR